METSAKNNEGVEDAFFTLARLRRAHPWFCLSIHTDSFFFFFLGISRPVSLILKPILRARRLVVRPTVPFALTNPPTKHQAVAHRIDEKPSCIPSGHYMSYTSRLGTHNKMVLFHSVTTLSLNNFLR